MLDPDACYAALRSRDHRFDGRFFVGVRSTGVYCRPVCPARTPRRDGIAFFPSAAAAQGAGFRACLRCRPETAPHGPAWRGTEATVDRALRLIEDGALDTGSVSDLAERLGIGDRHLRGLFRRHLGASPTAVAQARRLRTARLLLDVTDRPVADIGLESGYRSVRRFNDAIRNAFGRAPGALRSRRGGDGAATIEVVLPYRPPLRFDALLDYLAARAIPGVEQVEGGEWAHGVAIDGQRGVVRVRHAPDRPALRLQVPAHLAGSLPCLVDRVRRAFDTDADPDAIHARLAGLDAPLGLRLPGAFDPFAVTVRILLGQQVSVKAASTLAGRLVARLAPGPGLVPFPSAQVIAHAGIEGIGLPGARAAAIRGLAQAVADGRITFETPPSRVELEKALCGLPGIGPWSAALIAMRAFGEPDAFPSTDLVLKRQLAALDRADPDRWRPWRAYAAVALWERAAQEHR